MSAPEYVYIYAWYQVYGIIDGSVWNPACAAVKFKVDELVADELRESLYNQVRLSVQNFMMDYEF